MWDRNNEDSRIETLRGVSKNRRALAGKWDTTWEWITPYQSERELPAIACSEIEIDQPISREIEGD